MNARSLLALPGHLQTIARQLHAVSGVMLHHQTFLRAIDAHRATQLAEWVTELEGDVVAQIHRINPDVKKHLNDGPPIQMLLICPRCSMPHVDKDEWAIRPHRTHRCEQCQHKWRPAMIATVGVEALTEVGGT